jgi:hypothetical protein
MQTVCCAELEHAQGLAVSAKRDIGRYAFVYGVLALISVCLWWPALLTWAVERGTVAGQVTDGLALPSGARATLLIMNVYFTWAVYLCRDAAIGQGMRSLHLNRHLPSALP